MKPNEKLEDIAKNPLAIFDHVNERAWKDTSDPEVATFISKTRAKIAAEPVRSQQYLMVTGYMAILRQKATGKTDCMDMLQQILSKRGYTGSAESFGSGRYN